MQNQNQNQTLQTYVEDDFKPTPLVHIRVLDHGYVKLFNAAGMFRRSHRICDALDVDPAMVARTSFGKTGQSKGEQDLNLVAFLQNAGHSTPIEHTTFWFEIKAPFFVVRQFDTHRMRSKNEISGRYVACPEDFYIPPRVRAKSADVKQGSVGYVDNETELFFQKRLEAASAESLKLYNDFVAEGVAPELARLFRLPNQYTVFTWKMDMHNLFNVFLKKRLAWDAQEETRAYAKAMLQAVRYLLPDWVNIWENSVYIDYERPKKQPEKVPTFWSKFKFCK
jgi:thymidylate synthase (FAD)